METNAHPELAMRVSALEPRLTGIEQTLRALQCPRRGEAHLAARYARPPSPETIALHVELAKLPFRLAFWILAALSIVAAVGSTIYRFWFD